MIQLIILGKNSIKILHRPLIIDITHIKLQPSYYYTIPSYPPMNVDYNNFPEVFEFISSNKIIEKVPPSLTQSSTISLDLEFTGIKMDNNDKERYDEFLFERYEKVPPPLSSDALHRHEIQHHPNRTLLLHPRE